MESEMNRRNMLKIVGVKVQDVAESFDCPAPLADSRAQEGGQICTNLVKVRASFTNAEVGVDVAQATAAPRKASWNAVQAAAGRSSAGQTSVIAAAAAAVSLAVAPSYCGMAYSRAAVRKASTASS